MRTNDVPDYYELLGVEKTASQDEIKAAWLTAAKQHHPDIGGNPALFRMLKDAYDTVGNVDRRAAYDSGSQSAYGPQSPAGGRTPSGAPPREPRSHNEFVHPSRRYIDGATIRNYKESEPFTWYALAALVTPLAMYNYAHSNWIPGYSQGWEMLLELGCVAAFSGSVAIVGNVLLARARIHHRLLAAAAIVLALLPGRYVLIPLAIEAAWLAFRLWCPVTWSPLWGWLHLGLVLTPRVRRAGRRFWQKIAFGPADVVEFFLSILDFWLR